MSLFEGIAKEQQPEKGVRQIAVGGESNEWYTPPEIFRALGCEFDLDPASPAGGLPWVPAKNHYSYHDDGLSQRWEGRVWLNPPYGPHTASWLGRLSEHGNGIALVFARTDVTWFHTVAPQASLVCFIRGRIQFVQGGNPGAKKNNAAAPSCLIAFGEDCAGILRRSGLGIYAEISL